jgi:hypothetical protein
VVAWRVRGGEAEAGRERGDEAAARGMGGYSGHEPAGSGGKLRDWWGKWRDMENGGVGGENGGREWSRLFFLRNVILSTTPKSAKHIITSTRAETDPCISMRGLCPYSVS